MRIMHYTTNHVQRSSLTTLLLFALVLSFVVLLLIRVLDNRRLILLILAASADTVICPHSLALMLSIRPGPLRVGSVSSLSVFTVTPGCPARSTS